MEQNLMETERMLYKANQIALNFAVYPRPQAVSCVAEHMKKFWTPAMRKQIVLYVGNSGQGLHELAIDAVRMLEEPAA